MIKKPTREKDRLCDYQNPEKLKEVYSDHVTCSVAGYYAIPPMWICRTREGSSSECKPSSLIDFETFSLSCGIVIKVTGEGEFSFDFYGATTGAPVFIPGYSYPAGASPHSGRAPDVTLKAQSDVQKMLSFRTEVLNVFQFLLCSYNRSPMRGGTWPDALSVYDLSEAKNLSYPVRNPFAYRSRFHTEKVYRSYVNNSGNGCFRLIVPIDCVEGAANLLEHALSSNNGSALYILNEIFSSMTVWASGRNGFAISGLWTVIEQILGKIWSNYAAGLSKIRREKLLSIGITASVRIEMLYSLGYIDDAVYKEVEIARKARNKWVHEMRAPTYANLLASIKVVERLMHSEYGIAIELPMFSDAGYTTPYIWMDERMLERHGLQGAAG